jgi:HAD superfamily hydrolase (TIGR01509 family)
MHPQFAAIIFDMDGVIVDSEPRHERAFREVFKEMGYGETHGMDFPLYYGRSDRALWIDFIEKHQPAWSLEELAEWKQRRFLEIIRQEQPIFADLPELLEDLAPKYQLAVASGSFHPVIDEVLGMKKLRRFFPVVVSVQDVPRGKPAPDVFLRAAELLKVDPGHCCVIEDAAAGVEAALSAGMQVIGITNSLSAEKLARATHVVQSYAEIRRLLLGHASRASTFPKSIPKALHHEL